jgi:hypothetical protein
MGMKCEAKEHASLLTNKEPERDPRINPMPGDVLRKKYQGRPFEARSYVEREVDEVDARTVTYVGPDVCAPVISRRAWRKWAATAENVTRAEEKQNAE